MKAAADAAGEQSPPPPKTVQIRNIFHLLITPDWCLSTSSILCLFCYQSALDDGLFWAAKGVLTFVSREEFIALHGVMRLAFWVRAPEMVCPPLASNSLRDKQHKCDRFSRILHTWHVRFQSELFHSCLNGSKILAQLTWLKQSECKCRKGFGHALEATENMQPEQMGTVQ